MQEINPYQSPEVPHPSGNAIASSKVKGDRAKEVLGGIGMIVMGVVIVGGYSGWIFAQVRSGQRTIRVIERVLFFGFIFILMGLIVVFGGGRFLKGDRHNQHSDGKSSWQQRLMVTVALTVTTALALYATCIGWRRCWGCKRFMVEMPVLCHE